MLHGSYIRSFIPDPIPVTSNSRLGLFQEHIPDFIPNTLNFPCQLQCNHFISHVHVPTPAPRSQNT